MSKNSLNVPADAVELSMNDLEGVTGAWGTSCGSCFIAFEHNFKAKVENCVKFVSFGGFGSCDGFGFGGSCGSCGFGGSCGGFGWGGSCGSCGW